MVGGGDDWRIMDGESGAASRLIEVMTLVMRDWGGKRGDEGLGW